MKAAGSNIFLTRAQGDYCGTSQVSKPRKNYSLGPSIQISLFSNDYSRDSLTPAATDGFSLIEVLIAMSIVFFLLLGMAQMLCYSLLLKQKADIHQLSANIISHKLEYLKALSPEDESLSPGQHQEAVKDESTDRIFILNWEVTALPYRMKKITLSLHQNSAPHRLPTRAVLFRSDILGF